MLLHTLGYSDAELNGPCDVEDDGDGDGECGVDDEMFDEVDLATGVGELRNIVEAHTIRHKGGMPLTDVDVKVLLDAFEITGYQKGKNRLVFQPDTLYEQMAKKTPLGLFCGRYLVHVSRLGYRVRSLFINLNFVIPGKTNKHQDSGSNPLFECRGIQHHVLSGGEGVVVFSRRGYEYPVPIPVGELIVFDMAGLLTGGNFRDVSHRHGKSTASSMVPPKGKQIVYSISFVFSGQRGCTAEAPSDWEVAIAAAAAAASSVSVPDPAPASSAGTSLMLNPTDTKGFALMGLRGKRLLELQTMSSEERLRLKRENLAVGGIRLEQPWLSKDKARVLVRAIKDLKEVSRLIGLPGPLYTCLLYSTIHTYIYSYIHINI